MQAHCRVAFRCVRFDVSWPNAAGAFLSIPEYAIPAAQSAISKTSNEACLIPAGRPVVCFKQARVVFSKEVSACL